MRFADKCHLLETLYIEGANTSNIPVRTSLANFVTQIIKVSSHLQRLTLQDFSNLVDHGRIIFTSLLESESLASRLTHLSLGENQLRLIDDGTPGTDNFGFICQILACYHRLTHLDLDQNFLSTDQISRVLATILDSPCS